MAGVPLTGPRLLSQVDQFTGTRSDAIAHLRGELAALGLQSHGEARDRDLRLCKNGPTRAQDEASAKEETIWHLSSVIEQHQLI